MRRLPVGKVLLLVLVCVAAYGFITRVNIQLKSRYAVTFITRPGGEDVIVKVDASPVRAVCVSPSSNLYHPRLGFGIHEVEISKPGYTNVKHTFELSRHDGLYPSFPPLQPVEKSSR